MLTDFAKLGERLFSVKGPRAAMDLQLIKAAFDQLDRNGDGIVNIREFIISVRKGKL